MISTKASLTLKEGVKESILKVIYMEIFPLLPSIISATLSKIPEGQQNDIEEIRLRADKPLMLGTHSGTFFLNHQGALTKQPMMALEVTQQQIVKSLEMMCDNSIYAFSDEIKNGFITLKGGHRVGLCGRTVLENGCIKYIKDISAMNIRISREVIGCANSIMRFIVSPKRVFSTLIVSAPKCGKTTILRDIARQLSNGISSIGFEGKKVSIIDERSEIAACYKGIPQNDVGVRTEVMDSCPKQEGMFLLLRSMSPEIIITDEIGSVGDYEAVLKLQNSGVSIITTAHGYDIEELKIRNEIIKLIQAGVFERIIVLDSTNGPGTIKRVVDGLTMKEMA